MIDFYEKESGQIKEMISKRMPILCNTIRQAKPNICSNTENPRSYSSCEIFDTNFPVLHLINR